MIELRDLLVPLDFSPASLRALDFALALADGRGDVYALHVVDADFVDRLAEEGFADREPAIERLRTAAEQRLAEILETRRSVEAPGIESMVVVGKPFAEILRIARDLDLQAIVMAARGGGAEGAGGIEELLFGSTSEKVLRGTVLPVVFVPGGPL